MKRIELLGIILIMALLLSACGTGASTNQTGNMVTIPDVTNTDEATATNILSSNGLIPVITKEYSDEVEFGTVISTTPPAGTSVEKNGKVDVMVSKGPAYIQSKDSTIQWYHVGSNEDEWSFNSPYIEEGVLTIDCEVTFGTSFKWKNGGFGNASITDTFDKRVPIQLEADKTVKAGEKTKLKILIPVTDLEVQKPTTLYVELVALIDGDEEDVKANFSMSW